MEKQRTLMLVDDQLESLQTLVLFLDVHAPEYKIIQLRDGHKALEVAAQKELDLLILDWELGGFDGPDVLRAFRKSALSPNIPVIIFSGKMTSLENLKSAFDASAIDFVRKPFDGAELLARVRALLKTWDIFQENELLLKQLAQEQEQRFEREKADMETRLDNLKQKLLAQSSMGLSDSFRIEGIRKAIDEALRSGPDKMRQALLDIRSELSSGVKVVQWSDFEMQMTEVHPDFFKRLLQRYPDLTLKDVKVCSFLRLNLNTKEIASMMSVGEQTVRQTRYRIRQKMGLGHDDSLHKALMDI